MVPESASNACSSSLGGELPHRRVHVDDNLQSAVEPGHGKNFQKLRLQSAKDKPALGGFDFLAQLDQHCQQRTAEMPDIREIDHDLIAAQLLDLAIKLLTDNPNDPLIHDGLRNQFSYRNIAIVFKP